MDGEALVGNGKMLVGCEEMFVGVGLLGLLKAVHLLEMVGVVCG